MEGGDGGMEWRENKRNSCDLIAVMHTQNPVLPGRSVTSNDFTKAWKYIKTKEYHKHGCPIRVCYTGGVFPLLLA